MIGKKIKNPDKSASKAKRIISLATYIRDPGTLDKNEKCIYSGSRGFITNNPNSQVAEMVALAQDCVRSKDPISHYVISFHEGETPSNGQVEECIDIFEKEMNMQGHQIIYGLHDDTDNLHIHVQVNRVHPTSAKAVKINNGFDVEALHKVIACIEQKQGWQREDNGRYLVLENGDLARTHSDQLQPLAPDQKARDMENKTGEKSAERIAIEVAGPILRSAKTWSDLHRELAAKGIRYEKSGSGAKIFVGDIAIKASSADRNASLSKMEKRLGTFEPLTTALPIPARKPEPLRESPEWLDYSTARSVHEKAKRLDKQALEEAHEEAIMLLATEQRKRRNEVLGKVNWKNQGALRNAMVSIIATEQAAEKLNAKEKRARERKQWAEKYPFWPTFENWLCAKNPASAQAWRYRASVPQQILGDNTEPIKPRDIRDFSYEIHDGCVHYLSDDVIRFVDKGREIDIHDWRSNDSLLAALQLANQKFNSFVVNGNNEYKAACVKLAAQHGFKISNPELQQALEEARLSIKQQKQERQNTMKSEQVKQFQQYHAAVNADRYRVTSIKMREDGSKAVFILDKKAGESKGFTPDEIEQRTQEMLRLQARGENIYYTPLSVDKHHILIDDLSSENLEKMTAFGYKPAVVLQSSEANFQAIITVKKRNSQFDKDTGNRVTEQLNREFGDPKLCGCIHPHRAPGYQNRKPKHKRTDGSYPEVLLLKSERVECDVTLELCKRIDANYRAEAAHKTDVPVHPLRSPVITGTPRQTAVSAYQTHYNDVLSRQKGEVDYSRVDAMVSIRLRVTGHSQTEIEAALRAGAPGHAREKDTDRDWTYYAHRTAKYAFSSEGDRQAATLGKRYKLEWRMLETGPQAKNQRGNTSTLK